MNTKVVILLSLVAAALAFAVTKSIVFAAVVFGLEMLLWVIVRAIKTQRWHTNNGTPPSLS